MHLMKVQLSYSSFDDEMLLRMGPEGWDELRHSLVGLGDAMPAWDAVRPDTPEEAEENKREGGKRRYRYWDASGLVTTEDAVRLTGLGIKLQVSRVRGLFSDRDPAAILADAQAGAAAGRVQIDISVPGGVALMSVRKVTWLEDACTNALQHQLDAGWRILAVCPANDTRRPTYIIGHEDPGA